MTVTNLQTQEIKSYKLYDEVKIKLVVIGIFKQVIACIT